MNYKSLFDFFNQEHELILLDGQLNDIIEEVKKQLNFQEKIENAFDDGVDDEYNRHINCADRIYQDGKDYFEKNCLEILKPKQ